MARPRKHNLHLPACVRFKHGAYYLVEAGKWKRLGKTLPKEYELKQAGPDTEMTRLVDAAMAEIYAKVKDSTASNYRSAVKHIKTAFAEYAPSQVTQAVVWDFREQFQQIPIMGNTALSLLRDIFSYATRKRIVENNPVIGVDRFPRGSRDRLIQRSEYDAVYPHCSPRLQCIIDLLFLTGQRVNDVIRLGRAQLTDEGIYFQQQKTGKRITVQWNDDLRAVIERAKALAGTVPSIYLFTSRGRRPVGVCRVREEWNEACKAAGVPDAQLRDLRAMALTEVECREGEEAAMRLAAHSSLSVTRTYLRLKKVVKVTGPRLPKVD